MPNPVSVRTCSPNGVRAPKKEASMKKIQAIVKKLRPAKDLSRNAWPYHVI
jgi:hypothetical protein